MAEDGEDLAEAIKEAMASAGDEPAAVAQDTAREGTTTHVENQKIALISPPKPGISFLQKLRGSFFKTNVHLPRLLSRRSRSGWAYRWLYGGDRGENAFAVADHDRGDHRQVVFSG